MRMQGHRSGGERDDVPEHAAARLQAVTETTLLALVRALARIAAEASVADPSPVWSVPESRTEHG